MRLGWAAWDWKSPIAELVMTRVINRVLVRLPPRPGCLHPCPGLFAATRLSILWKHLSNGRNDADRFAIPIVGVMGIPLYRKIKTQSISPHKVQGDIGVYCVLFSVGRVIP